MKSFFRKHWAGCILAFFVFVYIFYFSWFTILRYRTLWAHYFDLGIMHQAVYNTYMSLKTGDFSRFLELTNPHGFDQIKRMAVHNDILLVIFAPLYFVYPGPEMLLVIQAVVLGLGAVVVFYTSRHLLKKNRYVNPISLLISCVYLFYPPLQRANQFEFHAVVLATTFLLCMYFFWLKKKYIWSGVFLVASLLSKEQVGLSTAFFGIYILMHAVIQKGKKKDFYFAFFVIGMSLFWFAFSFLFLIPHYRQLGTHFAVERYTDFGETPTKILLGLFKKPALLFSYIFQQNTFTYITNIFGPLAFLSFLSPLHIAIVIPEIAINLLSKEQSMSSIYYQYTAVITPFLFIALIEGIKKIQHKRHLLFISLIVLFIATIGFSFYVSPLPYSQTREVYPILWPAEESSDSFFWQDKLKDDSIKVMATGHIAPVFASRRYLYLFSSHYDLADYIVLSRGEVYNSYDSAAWKPVYERLQMDSRFTLIYKRKNFEVYKKL